ncbi:MAG: hypothetical protein ABIT01_01290 [Thermoanaerobaculia bacterium]
MRPAVPGSYGLYSPRVEDRNVRRLYQLKLEHHRRTGKKVPMTVLINRILDDFFGADEPAAPEFPKPHDASPTEPL